MKRCFSTALLGFCIFVLNFGASPPLFGGDEGIVSLDIGDKDAVEDLTLLNRVKELALGVLSWILAPVAGAFTTWRGWQMIGQAERGDKGAGIVVFLCGIGMFALGRIIEEVLTALQG